MCIDVYNEFCKIITINFSEETIMTKVLKAMVFVTLYCFTALILYTAMIIPWIVSMVVVILTNHRRLVGLNQFIRVSTEGL